MPLDDWEVFMIVLCSTWTGSPFFLERPGRRIRSGGGEPVSYPGYPRKWLPAYG
jgi:hypothetical protein